MIGIAVRLWEIITRLSKVRSNSIPRGQDVQGYHCPHSQRIPHNIIPNNTRGLAMDNVVKHVLGNWSVVAATITALGLLVAVVRYKIPELAKKVAEMEVANKISTTISFLFSILLLTNLWRMIHSATIEINAAMIYIRIIAIPSLRNTLFVMAL